MSRDLVTLVIPARTEYLIVARLALAGIARGRPIDDGALADLKLAVTEACGNAVRHAYGNGSGPVDLAFVMRPDRLEMIVEDQGSGITAEQAAAEPVSEPLVESGMGLSIIRAVVDELDVRPGADGNGTVVHMTKRLAAPAP